MKNNFTIEEVKKFWDNVASEYDRINSKIGDSHYQRFVKSVNRLNINKNKEEKILNIWSRTGNAISYLKKEYPKINLYNLEVSPEMIKITQKKYPNEKLMITDLQNLQFDTNYFDAILSLETLEHSPNPKKLITEFYRVLKPGGTLVMSLPPKTAEIPLKIYELFFENHGEGPHRFMPSKEVKNLLKNARFKIIEHSGTLLIPAGPKFLQQFGEKIINIFQNTPIKELGIRQFYTAKKIL
ncbi:methyltransferase domain-containing protein [Candidatus Parcubacteria bacterium]|nr:methyltransferase domain-containing protein [Candidatus Parcubacteria bacterium]